MGGGEHSGDSHFVGHVKHQRGDRDEDQAHPEDARAEHHFRLSHTHTHRHIDIHLVQTIEFNKTAQMGGKKENSVFFKRRNS